MHFPDLCLLVPFSDILLIRVHSVMGVSIIIVKIISLCSKNKQVKKNLSNYAFIEGEMASES